MFFAISDIMIISCEALLLVSSAYSFVLFFFLCFFLAHKKVPEGNEKGKKGRHWRTHTDTKWNPSIGARKEG